MSLLDNLVSYYKLDEASGSALDAHGANTLSQVGSVGTAAGKVGTARDFPGGAAGSLEHASNADLQTGDIDFSFACWFFLDAISSGGYPVIAQKEATGTYAYEWQLYANAGPGGSGPLEFRVKADANKVQWPTPTAGVWYHVVCWHDAINNTIGIAVNNGTPVTFSYAGGITVGTQPFRVGGWPVLNRIWDGRIDEVGFWKRVLTADERAQLYNGGAGLAYESFAPPPPVVFARVVGSVLVR